MIEEPAGVRSGVDAELVQGLGNLHTGNGTKGILEVDSDSNVIWVSIKVSANAMDGNLCAASSANRYLKRRHGLGDKVLF